MFEWLTLPCLYGLALLGSLLLGGGLEAAEKNRDKDKDKRKPCQMKDGSWFECRAQDNQMLPVSDYVLRPADKANKSKAPLVLLAGGPGQAAREAFIPLSPMLEELGRDYDLILFNPRGTTSPARLACPLPDTLDLKSLTEQKTLLEGAKTCLKTLGEKWDLNEFGTDAAVQDLESIRQELGYDKLSFYGVSYGTRLALRYAALFPDRVEKMVLEGVLPPEAFIGQDTYEQSSVIKTLSARCQRTDECSRSYSDVFSSYQKLKQDFAKPRTLELTHPRTGRKQSVTIDAIIIDTLLMQLLYSEFDQTLLPAIIHQAAGGNLNPLIASSFGQSRNGVYEGLYFSVLCREDAPFYDSTRMDARLEGFTDICLSYPFKPADIAQHKAVKGPWPTLLLSGELDPVTPPKLIETLKTNLSQAKHVVIPGKGHNVYYLRCVSNQIKDFLLDKPNSEACETKSKLLPFYIEESKR